MFSQWNSELIKNLYSHCAIVKLQRLVYAEKWRGKKQAANAFEVPIMQYQKGYVFTII